MPWISVDKATVSTNAQNQRDKGRPITASSPVSNPEPGDFKSFLQQGLGVGDAKHLPPSDVNREQLTPATKQPTAKSTDKHLRKLPSDYKKVSVKTKDKNIKQKTKKPQNINEIILSAALVPVTTVTTGDLHAVLKAAAPEPAERQAAYEVPGNVVHPAEHAGKQTRSLGAKEPEYALAAKAAADVRGNPGATPVIEGDLPTRAKNGWDQKTIKKENTIKTTVYTDKMGGNTVNPRPVETAKPEVISSVATGQVFIQPVLEHSQEAQNASMAITSGRYKSGRLARVVSPLSSSLYTRLKVSRDSQQVTANKNKQQSKLPRRLPAGDLLSAGSAAQAISQFFEQIKSSGQRVGENGGRAAREVSRGNEVAQQSPQNLSLFNPVPVASIDTDVSKWVLGQVSRSGLVGASSVVLTLIPEHLGKLRLTVTGGKSGQVQVKISASNANALGLIAQNLDHLRQQLENNGFQAVTINLGMDQSNGQQGSGESAQGQKSGSEQTGAAVGSRPREYLERQYTLQEFHQGFIAEA